MVKSFQLCELFDLWWKVSIPSNVLCSNIFKACLGLVLSGCRGMFCQFIVFVFIDCLLYFCSYVAFLILWWFQIEYPEIDDNARPRHRFMSSFEQVIHDHSSNMTACVCLAPSIILCSLAYLLCCYFLLSRMFSNICILVFFVEDSSLW